MMQHQKMTWNVHSKHSDYKSASSAKGVLTEKYAKIRRRADDTFDVVIGKELKKDKGSR